MSNETPESRPGLAEATARGLIREIVSDLEAARSRLTAACMDLPVSPRSDVMLLGEEEADFTTEARRTIECVLQDHLEPLIQALLAAADYQPAGEGMPEQEVAGAGQGS